MKKKHIKWTVSVKLTPLLRAKVKQVNKLLGEIEKLVERGTTLQRPKS